MGDAVRSTDQDGTPRVRHPDIPVPAGPVHPREGRPYGGHAAPRPGGPAPRSSTSGRTGTLRRSAAVAVAAGGAFAVVGAAVPIAGTSVEDQRPTTAAFLLSGSGGDSPDASDETGTTGPTAGPGARTTLADPPPTLNVDELTGAVRSAGEEATRTAQRLEEQRKALEAEAAAKARATTSAVSSSGATSCGIDLGGLGAVRPWVRDAAEFLGCQFDEPQVLGVGGRAGTSDHPSGLAADFMVDRATGDSLAACALENRDALGISYVIWEQQINFGNGWEPMEDRGGDTANHFDHVHVSFDKSTPGGAPVTC